MSNFSNKHIKMVVNEDKQDLENTMLIQIEKNKKDITECVDERIKNDKDIDAIRKSINCNQKILKDLLVKMEYLEEKTENYRLQYMKDKDVDDSSMEALVEGSEDDSEDEEKKDD